MKFEASPLSEGTESYGDARNRALYSQIMLRTYGQQAAIPGGSYGDGGDESPTDGGKERTGLSSETIASLTQAGAGLLSTGLSLVQQGIAGKQATKQQQQAAAASERQSRADALRAEKEAKLAAQQARIAEAQAAASRQTMVILGGLGLVAILVGGGLFYAIKVKK